jgi:hypothetical protein
MTPYEQGYLGTLEKLGAARWLKMLAPEVREAISLQRFARARPTHIKNLGLAGGEEAVSGALQRYSKLPLAARESGRSAEMATEAMKRVKPFGTKAQFRADPLSHYTDPMDISSLRKVLGG